MILILPFDRIILLIWLLLDTKISVDGSTTLLASCGSERLKQILYELRSWQDSPQDRGTNINKTNPIIAQALIWNVHG
jgi:hypothetical protein